MQHCPRRFVPTRAASAGERGAPRLGLHRLRPRRLGPHHRRAAAPARCSPWSEAVNAQWSDAHEIHTVYAWLLYAAASREQASETRKGKCSGLNAKSAIDIEALAIAVVFTKHRGGAALVCAVARAHVAARQCASRQWPVAMAFRRNSHGLCALMRAPSAGVRLHPRRTRRCCGEVGGSEVRRTRGRTSRWLPAVSGRRSRQRRGDNGLDESRGGRGLCWSSIRVYPGLRSRIQRPSAARGWTVNEIPSTPDGNWGTVHLLGCRMRRQRHPPAAGEPRAGKRAHEVDAALEQNLGAPVRHPPPPAWALGTKRRRLHVRPVAHAQCRSAVPQAPAGGRPPRRSVARRVCSS